MRYTRDEDKALQILNDGFLKVFQKIGTFRSEGSFEGWMKRVMINHVLQQYRKETFLNLVPEKEEIDNEIELDDENIDLDYLLKIIL